MKIEEGMLTGAETGSPETHDHDERGMATAELLANAALGVAALAGIWVLLSALGLDVVNYISDRMMG